PVERASKSDTVSTIIENLSEGSYTFEFITFDNEGNSSLPVDTVGEAFGDIYISSLPNRLVKAASIIDDNVKIEWYDQSNKYAVKSELVYKSLDEVEHRVNVS